MLPTRNVTSTVPAFSKRRVACDRLALNETALQIDEHQVIAAGRKLDAGAGLDLEPAAKLTHPHHTVGNRHLVDLDPAGNIRAAADQAIRRRARIGDFEITAGNLGAAGRRARPWRADGESPSLTS